MYVSCSSCSSWYMRPLLLPAVVCIFFLPTRRQSDRDAEVIKADEACDKAATELESGRKSKGRAALKKQREAFGRRRAERADAWAEQLSIQVRPKTSFRVYCMYILPHHWSPATRKQEKISR